MHSTKVAYKLLYLHSLYKEMCLPGGALKKDVKMYQGRSLRHQNNNAGGLVMKQKVVSSGSHAFASTSSGV